MPERPRRVQVDPPRGTAYDVLKAVRVDDAYANLVLPTLIARDRLAGRDAAFATELASGAIRGRGLYEPVIRSCLDRPRLEAKVLDALLLGAHQLLAMRVPDHAAISTTVDLVRGRVGPGPVGLANAVLRKVAAHDRDEWVRRVAPDAVTDPVGHAAVAHSHPRWVVEGLRDSLAASGAGDELEELLAADNAPPRVTLVARPGLASPDELPGEPGRWSPYAVHLPGGAPGEVTAVAEACLRVAAELVGRPVPSRVAAAGPRSRRSTEG
jgi:16S rRNA (cytosine967-C5)-methyltransferase